MNSGTVKLNVDEVLSFFDERPADSKGHASGLIAVVGEELGSFLLCRHLEVMHACKSRMFTHEGKPITPTIGTNKGRRLDRWVLTESESEAPRLYQVEIKNWNAHSKDGKPLKLSADEAEIQQYRIDRWAEHWLEDKCEFRYEEAHKVLLRMKPPLKADDENRRLSRLPLIPDERIEPVICFWWPVHPEGRDESLWFHQFHLGPINGFRGVWTFSMSNYLRRIRASGAGQIEVTMPILKQRMAWLSRLFEIC